MSSSNTRHNREIIYLAGFLFALPVALTSYINSSFLSSYFNEYAVSILYVVASLFTIWSMMEMPKAIARFGDRMATFWFSILTFFTLLVLAFVRQSFFVVLAFIIFFATTTIVSAALDIFVEDFSKSGNIGRFRGFYLTIANAAWVVSQIISGSVIAKSSFMGIYLLSALFMLIVSALFILFFSDLKEPRYKKIPVWKTIKYFYQNKNASRIYWLNFILQFFYAWMVIYMPIYLHQYIGFSWGSIGIIFTIMLLPFVILSAPLGKLSDSIGEKKLLIAGFLISTVFVIIIPLMSQHNVWLWAGIMFATRVGAAIIGAVTDIYFFKIITKESIDSISFYRNTSPLSYVIAPLIAIPVLFYTPSFKYIFFVLSAIMLTGFFMSLRLKDVT